VGFFIYDPVAHLAPKVGFFIYDPVVHLAPKVGFLFSIGESPACPFRVGSRRVRGNCEDESYFAGFSKPFTIFFQIYLAK
jgi:hypothetical protein